MAATDFRWEIHREGARTTVVLYGAIDENSDLSSLWSELPTTGGLSFTLANVKRINSCGVREWVNFMRRLNDRSVELQSCSPVIVNQLNMIRNFTGNARVTSVLAPYICESCGKEFEYVVDVSSGAVPSLESRTCGKGKDLEFDDLEDSYFAFLMP